MAVMPVPFCLAVDARRLEEIRPSMPSRVGFPGDSVVVRGFLVATVEGSDSPERLNGEDGEAGVEDGADDADHVHT
jgi:hypothetical protein